MERADVTLHHSYVLLKKARGWLVRNPINPWYYDLFLHGA
jgi:hypothetical protein